ncbi:MAG: hypothetical protein WAM70_19890, partial [Pyrinomonadaceae bacterium]
MKTVRTAIWVAIVCAAVLFGVRVYTNTAHASFAARVDHPPVPEPTPTNAPTAKADVKSAGGLTTATFDTNFGKIRVHLPDDMRAGDTISGTVVAEPNGQTKEERARNQQALSQYEVMIANSRPGANDFILKLFKKKTTKPITGTGSNIDFSEPCVCPFGFGFTGGQFVTVEQTASTPTGAAVPETCLESCPAFLAYGSVLDNASGDATTVEAQYSKALTETQVREIYETKETGKPASEPKPNEFRLPSVGQQGRPIEIFGPFDGNSSNTILKFGPPKSTVQDFEKGTENVSGGFGVIKPLAESPRKIVFESPTNVTGPIELNLKEGNVQTKGTYRNVGVNLSAPKTNLLKGEKTILTIEVRGLEGIQKPVPLTLTSEGVITMEGGPYQPLMIQPSQVDAGGRYSTTRGVTGIQAGGWGATATLVIGRFNIWLQDDADPNRIFHFNSFTGDYVFACGGGSCRTGGTGGTSSQPPTGSSAPPPPVTLTGIGKPAMKGCIITLSHNAPDRRVFAKLDACTKT